MSRRILAIGTIYILALAILVGAVWVVAHAIPAPAAPPTPSVGVVATLRPIWPASGSTKAPDAGQAALPRPTPTLSQFYITVVPSVTPSPAAANAPGDQQIPAPPSNTEQPSGQPADTPPADAFFPPDATPFPGMPDGTTGLPATVTETPAVPLQVTSGPPATPTATMVPADFDTSEPGQTRIVGRVVLNGVAAGAGVTLRLQTQSYQAVVDTTAAADGTYAFNNLAQSADGYNVVFSQDWNSPYMSEEIATWAWLGPIYIQDGQTVTLPDFDISLKGMRPLSPAFEQQISQNLIFAGEPISFTWWSYPQATDYWVDVARGADLVDAWQSELSDTPEVEWYGALPDGSSAPTGDYWWGVGAERELNGYVLTVYSYLTKFILKP